MFLLDQVPPFALIMYPPCPNELKLNWKDFETTMFLWHTPTAIQLELHYFILKWKVLLSEPFYRLGSIIANLYPALFWDFIVKSLTILISLCLSVVENLNFGDFFHMLVLLTDYYNDFWYYFNFLFTSSTLFEIIVLISWLHVFKVSISYYSVTSVLISDYLF